MNLVRWFRKNNTKIMAVVVIVLMIGFVGGSSLSYFLRGSGGANKALAYYGAKHKISGQDRAMAQQELKILQSLRADDILRSQDLRGIVLSELLFSQNQGSAQVLNYARQTIQRNRYYVSEKQLSDIYTEQTVPPDIYWILLREEARAAGIHIRITDVGSLLGQVIPRLFDNAPYAQVMGALVKQYQMQESDILTTFGHMLAILQYAETVCSTEPVTTAQVRHIAGGQNESLNAEFVQIKSSYFADKDNTPSDGDIKAQFDKYKDDIAGDVSEANPYGFGYKLPNRIQLDYIALKPETVATTVTAPTQEEAEAYYRLNRERRFTEQVLSDANDPNSLRVPQIRSYADVAEMIMEQLTLEKISTKTEQILIEAKIQADAGLEITSEERAKLTLDELKDKAGKYAEIAEALGQKYGLPIYSGRTGLLSATDVQNDPHLGTLYVSGYGNAPIRLTQMLFSAKNLGEDATILMFVPKAELYASIGPAKDPRAAMMPDQSGQIMALVRIVKIEPGAAPESADVTYSTKTLGLGEPADDAKETTYSVKSKVIEDLGKLAAWDTAKAKAQELIALAAKDGWENAATQFNTLYGAQAKAEPNDPNVFEVQRLTGLRRISGAELEVLRVQIANRPDAAGLFRQATIERQFVNRLHALVPAGAETLPQVPLVMEFKADQSIYCLKSLSIQRLSQPEFEKAKGMLLRQEDYAQSQSLAVVHFNPKNILARMKFQFAKEPSQPVPSETEELPEDPV